LLHQGGVGHGEDQQLIKTEARRIWRIFNKTFTDESKGVSLPKKKPYYNLTHRFKRPSLVPRKQSPGFSLNGAASRLKIWIMVAVVLFAIGFFQATSAQDAVAFNNQHLSLIHI
jgi:hypothetical protein